MRTLLIATVVTALSASAIGAQTAAPEPARSPAIVPLKVRVVVSRYQGEKRLSAMPFEVSVRSDNTQAQLRMGIEVPVPSVRAAEPKPGDPPAMSMSFNYRTVGTNIDVSANAAPDGAYRLDVLIEDSTVVEPSASAQPSLVAGAPIFRAFRSRNTLLLRDGGSMDYTLATDRLSGESVRANVTLTVVR